MIARALIHEPKVLFLDEPTTGLDPQARLFVWDRVRELRDRGVTMLLTTHDMDEASGLSDRVGIIDHGKLLALDTPTALTRGQAGQSLLDLTVNPGPGDDPDSLIEALSRIDGVDRAERLATGRPAMARATAGAAVPAQGNGAGGRDAAVTAARAVAEARRPELRVRLYLTTEPAAMLGPVVATLAARSATLSDVHIGEPSLEDVFIELTGRGLR